MLDYAFLAGYAGIRGGALTVLDASFTVMRIPRAQQLIEFYLAGRIRVDARAKGVSLRVKVCLPRDVVVTGVDTVLPTRDAARYDGKAGVLFALRFNLPAVGEGLHMVGVFVNDAKARVLKFDLVRGA